MILEVFVELLLVEHPPALQVNEADVVGASVGVLGYEGGCAPEVGILPGIALRFVQTCDCHALDLAASR